MVSWIVTHSAEKIVRVVKNWKNVGQSHPGLVTRPCTNMASRTRTTATPTQRHGWRRATTGRSASSGTTSSGGPALGTADVTEVVDTVLPGGGQASRAQLGRRPSADATRCGR